MNNDWEFGLQSTLPASQSSAIIVGEVTDAHAFLSEDKSKVYSEFHIRVEEVIKNDIDDPIKVGEQVAVERLGGRVRFPQGQIGTYIVVTQGVPEIGRKYILFLGYNRYEAGSRGAGEMNRHILTGYEVRASRVFALDPTQTRDGDFKKHEGKEVTSFLTEIKYALAISGLVLTSHLILNVTFQSW
jgi:hypothetical protein